jgi:hypothetical protein
MASAFRLSVYHNWASLDRRFSSAELIDYDVWGPWLLDPTHFSLYAQALRCRSRPSSYISRLGPPGSYRQNFKRTLLPPQTRAKHTTRLTRSSSIKLKLALRALRQSLGSPRRPAGDKRTLTTSGVDEWWKSKHCSIACSISGV